LIRERFSLPPSVLAAMASGAGGPDWWHDAPRQLATFAQHIQRQFGITEKGPPLPKVRTTPPAPAADAWSSAAAPSATSRNDQGPWRATPARGNQSSSVTNKAELGRATWVLLHTLAAQYPARPTKHQRADVKTFITSLAKVYPCGECAQHFQDVIRYAAPPITDDDHPLATGRSSLAALPS
jgi:hypothetical protein